MHSHRCTRCQATFPVDCDGCSDLDLCDACWAKARAFSEKYAGYVQSTIRRLLNESDDIDHKVGLANEAKRRAN